MLIRNRRAPGWHSPRTTAYENEAALRDLIADSPFVVPGIDERPVAVATELGVPAVGQADVVVVDAAGEITIVECKLATNAEIRRWVIGQVLSYAAGLWRLKYQELARAFAARDADLTAPFTNDPEWEEAAFRDAVEENLASGAFRLVIAVDAITDELKRTVVYINRMTVPELRLLALELRYAVDEDVEILLPEVYGVESGEQKGPGPREKRQWDRDSFLAELEAKRGPDEARVGRELIEWARDQKLRIEWGTGVVDGSFFPILDHADENYWPFSLVTNGTVRFDLRSLMRRPPFDDAGLRREFVRRLNQIPGVAIPEDAISRQPSFRLALLAGDPEALKTFHGTLEWFGESVRSEVWDQAED